MVSKQIDLTAKDNTNIKSRYTLCDTKPTKGIIILVHGFGEHIGNYREIAEELAEAGYASIVHDQRGHGDLSPYGELKKLQGVIPNYMTLLDDIDIVITKAKELAPDLPIILYGHSMGGNIALNYLLKSERTDITCVILESPWFGLCNGPGYFVVFLARILGSISRRFAIYNKLSPEDLTGDIRYMGQYDEDPLYHNRMSLRLFAGVIKGCAFALLNASKLRLPIFCAIGDKDKIVCNRTNKQLIKTIGDNAKIKEYDAHHAIRFDKTRSEFIGDITAYLDSTITV